MDVKEFIDVCNKGVDAGYVFHGGIRPNAVEAMGIVASLGHEIIIITDRQFGRTPESSEKATVEWLSQHGIEYDELWFSADKTITHADMFVEDKLSNYDNLTAVGVDTYLINRDWNLDPGDSRQRIDDIIEYAWAVEAATKSVLV